MLPLWIASRQGHFNTVTELLRHFAQVNKCCDDGISPLQIASYNNMIKVVKVLFLCQDIIIDLSDEEGRSSLYLACQQGHIGVVQELLQQTAEISICSNKGASLYGEQAITDMKMRLQNCCKTQQIRKTVKITVCHLCGKRVRKDVRILSKNYNSIQQRLIQV